MPTRGTAKVWRKGISKKTNRHKHWNSYVDSPFRNTSKLLFQNKGYSCLLAVGRYTWCLSSFETWCSVAKAISNILLMDAYSPAIFCQCSCGCNGFQMYVLGSLKSLAEKKVYTFSIQNFVHDLWYILSNSIFELWRSMNIYRCCNI